MDNSFFDNIITLYKGFVNNNYFILTLFIFLIFLLLFLFMYKKKKQKNFLIIYVISLLLFLLFDFNQIIKMIDTIFTFIIDSFYFPNFVVYLAMIAISNFGFLYIVMGDKDNSIFSMKEQNIIKLTQIIMYVVLQYLLVLILNFIFVNNVDVLVRASLYSNELLVALIQMSTLLFASNYIFIFLFWLIRKIKTDGLFAPKNRKVFNQKKLIKNLSLKKKIDFPDNDDDIVDIDKIKKEEFIYDYVDDKLRSGDVSVEELEVLKDIAVKYNNEVSKNEQK